MGGERERRIHILGLVLHDPLPEIRVREVLHPRVDHENRTVLELHRSADSSRSVEEAIRSARHSVYV